MTRCTHAVKVVRLMPNKTVTNPQGFGVYLVLLSHIAFDTADAEGAIGIVESRGAHVDLPQDAMNHGPEQIWYHIDNRDPYPVDHPGQPYRGYVHPVSRRLI